MHYQVSNTLNASMGAAPPTSFSAGALQFAQGVSDATISRLFPELLAGTNVVFGGEYRAESCRIEAGEPGSYTRYKEGQAGAEPGAQGFPGYSDRAATSNRRFTCAGFLDREAGIVKRWTVDGSLRFESYSSFGSTLVFNLATRVQLPHNLVLRAGYNSGFRAPSL